MTTNPCEICMRYSQCTKQEEANEVKRCNTFSPNILAILPHSLNCQYPNHSFTPAIDITTGFLKIAVHKLGANANKEYFKGVITIETSPFNKWEFQKEVEYKFRKFFNLKDTKSVYSTSFQSR